MLTYRFWSASLHSDPSVIGKSGAAWIAASGARIGDDRGGSGTVGAVSGGNGDYRECRDEPTSSVGHDGHGARAPHDGGLRAAGAGSDSRGRALRAAHAVRGDHGRASGGVQARGPLQNRCDADARSDQFARQHGSVGAVCGVGAAVCDCVLECGQSGAGANGSPRIGAGGALGAGSQHGGAAAFAAGGKPGAVRKRSAGGADAGVADGGGAGAVCSAFLGARRRADARLQPGVVWHCAGADGGGVPGADSAAALRKRAAGHGAHERRWSAA